MTRYFSPELFKFLKSLKRNNRREWFQKNKERYEEELKQPMLRFITDLKAELQSVHAYIKVDPKPVGGSLFRIYRDMRFSEDKSPYKTHLAAHFHHRSSAKDVHTPGYYLHLEPGACFAAAGIWRPDAPTLLQIRQRIVQEPAAWRKIIRKIPELGGDSLKKAPKGFDAEHPHALDLKRKDFISSVPFTEKAVCSGTFMKQYLASCQKIDPLLVFLTDALGLPW